MLHAMKQHWGKRLTTVFARQGHYATDPTILAAYPAADISLESIGELAAYDLSTLLGAAQLGRP
jgi:hypothetical protein